MNIHKYDISDIIGKLPEIDPFEITQEIDLIICSLGFEERTHKIIDLLCNNDKEYKNLLLITYPTNIDENESNRAYFDAAKKKIKVVEEIRYDRYSFYSVLKKYFRKMNFKNKKIVFDISTCSSYLMYPILKTLFELDVNLTVAYTEAESYSPTLTEWKTEEKKARSEGILFSNTWDEANFQSIGVDDVYSFNLFSEMNSGNKPAVLVTLPNFSSIRMNSIIEKDSEINKTLKENIYWFIGIPPSANNIWRGDALIKTYNLANSKKNIRKLSTLKYKETIIEIETIWDEMRYSSHLSIGSLGSKMQHLGTFFFLYLHQDVGLWLAEPKEFKAKAYSQGSSNIHQINFNSTKKLIGELSKYLQFKWEF